MFGNATATRRFSRLLAGPMLVVVSVAACSSGGGAATAGAGGGATAPVATPGATAASSTAAPTVAVVPTQASGGGSDFCSLFTAAEIQALVPGVGNGTSDPAKPTNCQWSTSDGALVVIHKSVEVLCEAERASVMGNGHGTLQGDYIFAGKLAEQDKFAAGDQVGDFCYELLVSPVAKAPAADAAIAFVKQLAQRAG